MKSWERVFLMAHDNGSKWDLSPNDREAILDVLEERAKLKDAVHAVLYGAGMVLPDDDRVDALRKLVPHYSEER